MNFYNCFKDIFESFHDVKKIVSLMFVIGNDKDLLHEVGFSQHDISRLHQEFKDIILEQHEWYLDYVKNEEESIIK